MHTLRIFIKITYPFIFILIAGCSSIDKITEDPEEMDYINYGMKITEVEKQLEYPSRPLYKFYNSKNEYFISMYKPVTLNDSYLLFYENNVLVSIIETEEGVSIWEENFGKYKNSLPQSKYFSNIVKKFKSYARLDSESFYPYDGSIYKNRSGSPSSQLLTISSTWGIAYFPYLFGASYILRLSEEAHSYKEDGKDYTDILKKINKIKLLSNRKEIIKKIGKPNYQHLDSNTTLLIYSANKTTILGLNDDRLEWIAFNYPIKINHKKNDISNYK